MILGLNETIDQIAVASNMCWYGNMLWRSDDHVVRSAMRLQIESQRKKWILKGHWRGM